MLLEEGYKALAGIISVHCKDKMPKIWNLYSQTRNIGVSVPISTLMCLWASYIFPRWVCLFCWRKYVDWSWKYINRSQTHECGNWGWGREIPRKGIYKRNCLSVYYAWDGTYQDTFIRKGFLLYRVPEFLSSRLYWAPPFPPPQASVSTPPPPQDPSLCGDLKAEHELRPEIRFLAIKTVMFSL